MSLSWTEASSSMKWSTADVGRWNARANIVGERRASRPRPDKPVGGTAGRDARGPEPVDEDRGCSRRRR